MMEITTESLRAIDPDEKRPFGTLLRRWEAHWILTHGVAYRGRRTVVDHGLRFPDCHEEIFPGFKTDPTSVPLIARPLRGFKKRHMSRLEGNAV